MGLEPEPVTVELLKISDLNSSKVLRAHIYVCITIALPELLCFPPHIWNGIVLTTRNIPCAGYIVFPVQDTMSLRCYTATSL